MKQLTFCALVVGMVLHPLSILGAEPSTSANGAKLLCDLMTARHLDAFAVRDASQPDRFVAALFIPHSQLLVITAKFRTPQALQPLLDQKSYRDVYGFLQTSPDASEQVFFIDMMADGLNAGPGEGADVMYEPGNKQIVFEEGWRKQHGLGEREYLAKYATADALYASLLKALAGAVDKGPAASR